MKEFITSEQYDADCDMQYITSSDYRKICIEMGESEDDVDKKIMKAIRAYENKFGSIKMNMPEIPMALDYGMNGRYREYE
jgi:hypothetical protein